MTSQMPWRRLLMHAVHCSVVQRSRLISLSVSPNSDESRKQSLYPDGDPDRHQTLIVCSLAHCQPSPQGWQVFAGWWKKLFFFMEKTGVAKIVFAGKNRNCEEICQNRLMSKKSKMNFCCTLKVHGFPFTMSLKLLLCAQYQNCESYF